MNDPSDPMAPEVVAFLRGELTPAEEVPVRAHLAGCPACAALAADLPRIRAAAAARPCPAPDAASRDRLAAALDGALAEAEAADLSRGPVVRLLERAGRRYAESRRVRFLTYSLAVHAAAAVVLAVHLTVGIGGGRQEPERILEVATADPLPPPYPDDPLVPTTGPMPGGGTLPIRTPADIYWPSVETSLVQGFPTPPVEDPVDGGARFRLYPGPEFASFASPRFRRREREKRFLETYGPVEGPRAALSVDRHLRHLASVQDPNGTWASGRPGDPAAQRNRFRGGVTGITTLAFIADGRTAMRRGPFSEVVRAAMDALARSEDPVTGLLGSFARGAANDRPLCNNGPALAALAEGYGVDFGLLPEATRRELASVIERAVAATLNAQLADGSFGYAPGARQGDSSVTLLQVEALESARRAGFAVDEAALLRAGAWLSARIGPDGRLGYREAGDRSKDATLTAEAIPLLRGLGIGVEVRDRMLGAVIEEAKGAALADRVLFRTAVLEALAAAPGAEARALAPAVARAAIGAGAPGGAVHSERDPYATAAGDSLATARTVRALTAPYRASW